MAGEVYKVYIIQSKKTGRYYVGMCQDIEVRLAQHNRGKTRSTKSGIPWVVIYSEQYNSRKEAYRRERQIKSYKGGNAFKKLIDKQYRRGAPAPPKAGPKAGENR